MKLLLAAIQVLSLFSALPAIIIGFRQKRSLWLYAWASLLCDISSYSLKNFLTIPHYLFNNVFILLEFLLVGYWLLRSAYQRKFSREMAIAILSFPGVYFLTRTLINHLTSTNFEDGAVLYGLLVILCIAVLYEVMIKTEHPHLEKSPVFIFASAFLLYASGSLLMILFDDYLSSTNTPLFVSMIWGFHSVLNILKNLAIARVFYLLKK